MIGYGLGFWLFVPWFAASRSMGSRQAWVIVWAVGWFFQVVGWLIYLPTYRTMDQYPTPVDFSKGLMGLSCLLWIVAFSLYRRVRPMGVAVLTALLIAGAVLPQYLPDGPPTPSDPELISNFHHHQEAFDQLERTSQADAKGQQGGIDGVSASEDFQGGGLSSGRVAQYHKLFAVVGVKGCTWVDGQRDIDLKVWGIGNALSSDADESYAYRTSPPANVLTSLEQCPRPDDRTSVDAYQRIQGNWYLHYTYIPS